MKIITWAVTTAILLAYSACAEEGHIGNIGNLGGFENSGFGTGGSSSGGQGGFSTCPNGGGCSVGPVGLQGKSREICCYQKPEGYYAIYSTGCASFYRCVPNDPRTFCFQCGLGTKFNPQTNNCDWPHNVDC